MQMWTEEANFREAQQASPDGFMMFRSVRDANGAIGDFEWLYANPSAERMIGLSADDLLGKRLLQEIPATRDAGLFERYVEVVETEQRFTREFQEARNGLNRWFRSTAVPVDDGFAVTFSDVTERRAAEAALRLLGEAGQVLVAPENPDDALQRIARLAVPRVADCCGIDLVRGGQVVRVALAHVDPAQEARLRRRAGDGSRGLASPDDPPGVHSDGTRLSVPIVARDHVFGAIHFAFADSGRRYREADLPVAEQLAHTVGAALERNLVFEGTERARELLEQKSGELERARAATETANEELREQTALAETARLAADEANAAKSEFLATMSHELRTPLNAIGGYAELLEMGVRGPLTPQQAADIAKIRRNQAHLLALINNILNFARIDGGRVRYDIEPLPVDQVLRPLGKLIRPQLKHKRIEFHYVPGEAGSRVRADEERVQQIVLNLLSNAVKFTPTGGRIELVWAAEGAWITIAVRDTGRGIPADKVERIWEPFVQVDPALTRATEGAGLGLAISRDLARAMGGELSVTSREGKGSVFTLRLPRDGAEPFPSP